MRVIFAYYGLSCAGDDLSDLVQYKSTDWARKFCKGKEFYTGQVTVDTKEQSRSETYLHCTVEMQRNKLSNNPGLKKRKKNASKASTWS